MLWPHSSKLWRLVNQITRFLTRHLRRFLGTYALVTSDNTFWRRQPSITCFNALSRSMKTFRNLMVIISIHWLKKNDPNDGCHLPQRTFKRCTRTLHPHRSLGTVDFDNNFTFIDDLCFIQCKHHYMHSLGWDTDVYGANKRITSVTESNTPRRCDDTDPRGPILMSCPPVI